MIFLVPSQTPHSGKNLTLTKKRSNPSPWLLGGNVQALRMSCLIQVFLCVWILRPFANNNVVRTLDHAVSSWCPVVLETEVRTWAFNHMPIWWSSDKDSGYQDSDELLWLTIVCVHSHIPFLAVINAVCDSMGIGLLKAPCLELFQDMPCAFLPLSDFGAYPFYVINYTVSKTAFSGFSESL